MATRSFILEASDGIPITVHVWEPGKQVLPRGVIQISHGMAEFALRYDSFALQAAVQGYLVYAADHRGHGQTAGSLNKLGHLADKDGFTRVMNDQRELAVEIGKRHPEFPRILFGHSFGSFIAQMLIERHGNLFTGCILSGTRGPDPVLVFSGRLLARIVSLLTGKRTPSRFLTRASFGSYNARIPDAKSPNSWLSRDTAVVEDYDVSPWCGFPCTPGFYRDLMDGLSVIHKPWAIAGIPASLHVLILSGSCDPVGSYGKTVTRLAELYRNAGVLDVSLVIYEGGRHEMLNETNRGEVSGAILAWVDRVTGKNR